MVPEERDLLIERYRDSFRAVAEALDRVGPNNVDKAPPGEWSPRQIIHHLADTELFRGARLRLLIAQDEPFIPGIDENRLAERLDYSRDVGSSLALMAAVMDANIELLDGLEDSDWSRAGTHEEFGPFSINDWLVRASGHGHEHATQILTVLDT
jgi:hypothetical protein